MMGAVFLLGLGMTVHATTPGSGHTVDVTTDDWDDDDDSKLTFEFQDIPVATYSGLHLTLSCKVKGAKILYTTDAAADPKDTSAWTVYTEPLYLTQDCTVRYFARVEGYNDSDVREFVFVYADHAVAAPTIAPDMDHTRLVMATETPGAKIRYTTDGSAPTATSTLYTAPVEITANVTFRARAFANDMFDSDITDYTVDFLTSVTPVATFANKAIVLSCADGKATVFYTFDAEASVDNAGAWAAYSAPIAVTGDCTVRFFSRRPGYHDSAVQSFQFVYASYQVAAPVLVTDDSGTHVMMSCETEGAQIRYTTDGSEPTSQSTLYTAPVEIISNGVFRARAFVGGMFDSNIAEFTVMHLAVPVPTATFANKHLILECSDSKAEIWYTTSGEATYDSTDAWIRYTSPVALTENCIVRFFGRRSGYNDSDIQSFNFVLSNYRVADPTIERNAEGTHIVMATTTQGAEIRYTTDGSEPTSESALYTAPLLIECNGTYSAIAVADGLFDSKVNRYVVSNMAVPAPAARFENKKMVLTCPDPKAQILYTTDNDAAVDDAGAWTVYTVPITLTGDCTLRFFGRRANFNDSDIESITFVYAAYQMQAPTIARNAQGTHIVITAPVEGAEIRYTSDGSEPTRNSTRYEKPVRIESGVTYRARVVSDTSFDSEITEYIIGSEKLNVPTAVYSDFALVLSTTDDGVSIWYTTDPELTVDNIDAWKLYTAPLPLTEDCTVRFFAGDDDANASDIQNFVFQRADYQVGAPTIERNEAGTHIVMETPTEGAQIRYTTDGSEPTPESTLYTDPVLIVSNGTFRARAFAKGMFESIVTDFFVTNMAVPVATAVFENKRLVLTCSDAEATIYYTFDDTAAPDDIESWTKYVAPIALTENCTVHFFTRRENFNDSDIETFVFLRANYQVATPVIERSEDGRSILMSCETPGAVIRYTTDGTEPTTESEVYTEPIFISMNGTFRARAYAENLFESEVSEFTVSNMVMMHPYATFEGKKLTLQVWDELASIWYTLDAEASPEDTEAWTLYTEPIALTGDCTVRFFARRSGFLDSQIVTFDFVYADYQAAMPVIVYNSLEEVVTMTCETEGVEIRYTTDGSEPTAESNLYSGEIAVTRSMVVRAIAFSAEHFASEIAELKVDYMSGIEPVSFNGSTLRIVSEGSDLVVYSDVALRLPVYNPGGVLVCVLDIESGRNVVTGLSRGVYVIAGIKVML